MSKSQKKNEQGRSMVEMLGVLAVIGILSVAGIAGYNTAMRSHKANEVLNAASMLYVMAQAKNQGNGADTNYNEIGTLPSAVSSLAYSASTKAISITFNDEKDCAMAKNKLGDKATDDCANKKLTVNLGEASGGITSSPWYKADCSIDNAPCVGNGYSCNQYNCGCYNNATNVPNCDENSASSVDDYLTNSSTNGYYSDTVACWSGGCECVDSSESYPNCTKTLPCIQNGTCHPLDFYWICFDTTKNPPDCE